MNARIQNEVRLDLAGGKIAMNHTREKATTKQLDEN
jgi:hypothetical protein